jgi:hypothetical protein
MAKYLGIDFSGGAPPWRATIGRPTVWISTVELSNLLVLVDIIPVQSLPGTRNPFDRLVHLLSEGKYSAAAIDAPFAIPTRHLPVGGYVELLAMIRRLPHAHDRPFPSGPQLIRLGEEICPKFSQKPLRATEIYWKERRVNTRSTMWHKPRGGAPFAAGCIALLSRAKRPIWPWWPITTGTLVEAFPAAQLRQWNLPHQGYSKPEQYLTRREILNDLRRRVSISATQMPILENSPDALDSLIASFSAIAAHRGNYVVPTFPTDDGLISVML